MAAARDRTSRTTVRRTPSLHVFGRALELKCWEAKRKPPKSTGETRRPAPGAMSRSCALFNKINLTGFRPRGNALKHHKTGREISTCMGRCDVTGLAGSPQRAPLPESGTQLQRVGAPAVGKGGHEGALKVVYFISLQLEFVSVRSLSNPSDSHGPGSGPCLPRHLAIRMLPRCFNMFIAAEQESPEMRYKGQLQALAPFQSHFEKEGCFEQPQ